MKRSLVLAVLALAFVFVAGSTATYAQGVFKIPFKFDAGGKKFAAGEYWIAQKGDGKISLRKEPGGEEVLIPFKERLAQPTPPIKDPQLVFDAVGNFEPSYTEYMTDYVLAEVWLPGEGGFLIHTTKGAHKTQVIKGEQARS
jgi:hypothetical protein